MPALLFLTTTDARASKFLAAVRAQLVRRTERQGKQAPLVAAAGALLSLIFERVWLDEQRVVAVQPKAPFAPFFQQRPTETAGKAVCKERERRDSNPRPPT